MLSRLQDTFQKVDALDMQRNFVASVSHELRTPLTTLRGNLGLLRRIQRPEKQADSINDMLQLARADAGGSLDIVPIHRVTSPLFQ